MNYRHRRIAAWGIVAVFIITCGVMSGQAETVEGVVFVDSNGNGVLDGGESGLSDVSISDGATVIQTDDEGYFQISLRDEARFIFVSTPTGTEAGSNWYISVVEGQTDDYNFALTSHDDEGPLVFIQLSDIHYAPTPEQFKEGLRDRRMVILPDPILAEITDDVNTLEADFVILTGDLVADAKYPEPSRVEEWMASVAGFASSFESPAYGVIGNHDVVRDESIGKTIYESYFGPAYYSFNIKGTHCVVLDTQQLVEGKLVYTVDAQQLAWLEQDLSMVDPEAPILVFCHEPTPDWAATDESAALFELLASQSITALINGHWHTNTVLQQEPFFELTSGAVCGAFWEGPGPDGSGFGYRVFRMARGNLKSIWQTAGHNNVDVPDPAEAILAWVDPMLAQVWGQASNASYQWDDQAAITVDVHWNGLWSSVSTNLNVSILANGYHTLTIEFEFADAETISAARTYYVSNPSISLEEIFEHPDTFQGKIVAAPHLEVRAVMGSDISAFDETKTIIITKVPYTLSRGALIGIVGMYKATSTAPIKIYDPVFFTWFDEETEE